MPEIKKIRSAIKNDGMEAEELIKTPKTSKTNVFIKVFSVLVIVFVAVLLVSNFTSLNLLGLSKNKNLDASQKKWEAVFLSNGQIYFGNVTSRSAKTLILEDVYYLQVASQDLQQTEDQKTETPLQNFSLVKLGNELHKPKDRMNINMEYVLFTEELEASSEIIKSIQRYIDEVNL